MRINPLETTIKTRMIICNSSEAVENYIQNISANFKKEEK